MSIFFLDVVTLVNDCKWIFLTTKKNAINDIKKGNNIRKKARFLSKIFKILIGLVSMPVSNKLFDKTARSGI